MGMILVKFAERNNPIKVNGYDTQLTRERVAWCNETMGGYGFNWRYEWLYDYNTIQYSMWYFANEKDATMFALKWGNL